MYKNNRKYNNNIFITEDTLAIMTDDQLKRLFIDLRSNINKNRRNRRNTREKEIEFCYVQRELQFRKDAKKINKK